MEPADLTHERRSRAKRGPSLGGPQSGRSHVYRPHPTSTACVRRTVALARRELQIGSLPRSAYCRLRGKPTRSTGRSAKDRRPGWKPRRARSGGLGTTIEIIRWPVRSRTVPHRRRPFRRGWRKAKYCWSGNRPVGSHHHGGRAVTDVGKTSAVRVCAGYRATLLNRATAPSYTERQHHPATIVERPPGVRQPHRREEPSDTRSSGDSAA